MIIKNIKIISVIVVAAAIITSGGLAIKSATPQGNLKVNPILGHDLEIK